MSSKRPSLAASSTSPEPSASAAQILERLELFGVRLGLQTTRPLLAELGDPQNRFRVVLVAGTNGKGSVSSLLAAMAQAAGYRVGLFTSPHLEEVEERVRVDGVAVTPERLAAHLRQVVEAAGLALEAPPTYFEALTAAAFLAFAEAQVDVAVVEVGMGGRLDATNASEPVLSVITPIGLDHQQHLGDTLEAIAREKAGILRSGKPAVSWPGSEEAARTLVQEARRVGAELVLAPRAAHWTAHEGGPRWGQSLRVETAKARHELEIAQRGRHQAENLVLAVLAAEALAAGPLPHLDSGAIARGAAAWRWPGRLEEIELPDGRRVLLDVAHNPAGGRVLADFLAELGGPYDLLFGIFRDKEAEAMLPPLARPARRVTLTTSPSPRGRDPRELAELIEGHPEVAVEAEPIAALEEALRGVQPGQRLVVAGSLYLVGAVREALRQRFATPSPASGPLFPALSDRAPQEVR